MLQSPSTHEHSPELAWHDLRSRNVGGKACRRNQVCLTPGGEEALLLAAHGFMNQSRWAEGLGAFINLESTGPAGPAYLFQHTGDSRSDAKASTPKRLARGELVHNLLVMPD